MNLRLTLDEIFHLIPEADTEGDSSLQEIVGISSLESARVGDLSFLGNLKYKSQVPASTLVPNPKGHPKIRSKVRKVLKVRNARRVRIVRKVRSKCP